jgi:hypothetical protein
MKAGGQHGSNPVMGTELSVSLAEMNPDGLFVKTQGASHPAGGQAPGAQGQDLSLPRRERATVQNFLSHVV